MQAVGQYWEQCAEAFLSQKGLEPIARNFSIPCGEIDLIMLDDLHIAFIEVRYRRTSRFGNARLSVTAAKQRRITRCAQGFLQQHPEWQRHPCRFDVIAYDADLNSREPHWFRAAFESTTSASAID